MAKVKINVAQCKGCGYCVAECPRKAIRFTGRISEKGYDTIEIDDELCIACGSCYRVCPDRVFEVLV